MIKVVQNTSEISLATSSDPYTQLYSNANEGVFYSLAVKLNSDRVFCKLEADGNTIFELDCDAIDQASGNDGLGFGSFSWDDSENKLVFVSPRPLVYQESLVLSARANSDSNNRDCEGYWITLEEF